MSFNKLLGFLPSPISSKRRDWVALAEPSSANEQDVCSLASSQGNSHARLEVFRVSANVGSQDLCQAHAVDSKNSHFTRM